MTLRKTPLAKIAAAGLFAGILPALFPAAICAQTYYPSRNVLIEGPGQVDGINYARIENSKTNSFIWVVLAKDLYATHKYSGALTVPGQVHGTMYYDQDFLNSNYKPEEREFKVEGIWNQAFVGSTELTSADLSNVGTAFWGYGIFDGCTGLTQVRLPNGMEALGSTFTGCTSLTDVEIPSSVKELGYTFQDCTSLKYMTIPSGITYMRGTFEGCTALEGVKFENAIEELDYEVFKDCKSLKSINLPGSIGKIEYGVFENCQSLTSVIIPDKVTLLKNNLFKGCTSLHTVTIPNVTYIGNYVFDGCNLLRSINISAAEPPRVSIKIGFSETVFQNAVLRVPVGSYQKYKSANLWYNFFHIVENASEGLIESGDLDCRKNEGDDGVTIQNCNNPDLTELEIPAAIECDGENYPVTDIDHYAFENSPNIVSLHLPASITHFCDETIAFLGNLKDLWVSFSAIPEKEEGHSYTGVFFIPADEEEEEQEKEKAAQANTSYFATVTLHVPAGQLDLYKSHEYWGKFQHITEDNVTGIDTPATEHGEGNVRYYDLNGREVSGSQERGIVIEVTDSHSKKIIR